MWLVEHYQYPNDSVDVVFVPYGHNLHSQTADYILDLGGLDEPILGLFDHKPPAFKDRNSSSSTRLVWEHLLQKGHKVSHLGPLVELVQEVDQMPRRGEKSDALKESERTGLLAMINRQRDERSTDDRLYKETKKWLAKDWNRDQN